MRPPGSRSSHYVSVHITASNVDEARTIGRALVKERLAACANIVDGIESIYWWDNHIENSPEALVFLKTRTDLAERLIQRAKELHSYDVPAILVLPIIDGNQEYFDWLDDELAKP